MKILCIDIGFVKPGFSLINYENETINIDFFLDITFKLAKNKVNFKSMNEYLNYFSILKLDLVVIEKQFTDKNKNIAYYMEGFFNGKGIKTIMKSPISCLRKKQDGDTRSIRKNFSVDLFNSFLIKNNLNNENELMLKKDCDLTDSVNIGLLYIHKEILKSEESFFDFNIKIENIFFKKFVKK